MKRFWVIIFGIILIAVGIIHGGNVLHIWDIDIFFRGWWTLFLIVPGLASLFQGGPNFGNIALILIGAAFLAISQNVVSGVLLMRLVFPALLILCGLSLLFGRVMRRNRLDTADFPRYQAVLSGTTAKNTSPDLQGAEISVFLGGAEIDFRQAHIHRDIEIQVSAILGGVELFVPMNVRVEARGVPILGGIENKAQFPYEEGGPTLFVNCNVVLGGIEIK